MKKIIIFLVVALILTGGWVGYNAYIFISSSRAETAAKDPPAATPSPTPAPQNVITLGGQTYTYDYFRVSTPSALTLIPNYSQKADVKTMMTDNNCQHAINGGFYDKTNRPLGLFQSDAKVLAPKIDSDLVNGFLWADAASGAAVIATDLPYGAFRFAMQTGPVLLFDGASEPLTVNNDTGARRMVAGKSTDNTLIFLTVYNGDSVYDGPLLANLPTIVKQISEKEHLGIADAINLDGGSASAFYSGNTQLSELSPVGSLFCVQ